MEGIMPTPKQVYSAQFKQEAVQLVRTSGKSCAEIARNLGVPAHYLVRWKKQQEQHEQVGRPVFTGRGKAALSAQEAELRELRKELEIARQERDILKKALGYFARQI
ncbi:transposase [Deinococcus radiophilus]|uniref:Transposase n=2 Tax=Deinococcus radiophilus TaxID=32062 RepID=A0A3S0HYW0_9DEIO|nr:transposase [Deinococcus radiophilus]